MYHAISKTELYYLIDLIRQIREGPEITFQIEEELEEAESLLETALKNIEDSEGSDDNS